jgi:small-conductance mechanosensitive channel
MDINRKIRMADLKRSEGGSTEQKIRIASYLVVCLVALAVYLLLKLHYFDGFDEHRVAIQKLALATSIVTLILLIAKWLERVFLRRYKVIYTRYNVTKMIRLLSRILIAAAIISFLFTNWYSAAVSLGLISLVLGFALQNPISSFIGWVYILIRQPYHVGDRIQVDTFRGDVVEVNYLDTTLWEFSGDYLTNDLPSGRLIRFPNSLVLSSAVFNYSWEKFPYIWNEIPFHVAYESDLAFVEKTIKRISTEELADMSENIDHFKRLIDQTPVDDLNVKEYPFISLRINNNTWVEVMVTYLVHPKKAAATRSILIRRILAELNAKPEKVLFPKSNAR